MNYWLMKSEPSCFSITDLANAPKKTTHWDGVRNYQARNILRDEIKKGDLVFYYHSNTKPPGIVGVAEVVKEGYPDFTAFDPNSDHPDPTSTEKNPRWFMVDIKHKETFKDVISLDTLKACPELKDMRLLQKGNRLSVMPVDKSDWTFIMSLK